MIVASIFVAAALLVGVVLRDRVKLFRWLFIPASVVAGFVGLAVVQAGEVLPAQSVVQIATVSLASTLSSWPGWLIAVVFAGMLLERGSVSARESASRVGRQGLMVWVIVVGETAMGLLATWLLVQPFYDVPNSTGMLIETGFAGGHGTAAAMGEVFAHPTVSLASGKDLGMLMATAGLVYGIVTGILWINVGVRRGWISNSEKPIKAAPVLDPTVLDPTVLDPTAPDPTVLDPTAPEPAASETQFPRLYSRANYRAFSPLLLQAAWLAIAFGMGMLGQIIVMHTAGLIDGAFAAEQQLDQAGEQLSKRLTLSSVVDFPLFIYTLFGGLIVRRVLHLLGHSDLVDGKSISRLTSAAMDILVVAAIASLNLQAVVALLIPFSILFVCGAIWTAVCLLLISRMLLPREHWFELGLINYGMSTGTTATGFVLLRMVDPELKSGAAEDYALAAPLSAPFIGGGMITVALPLLVLERVSIAIPSIALVAAVIAMVIVGRIWNRKLG